MNPKKNIYLWSKSIVAGKLLPILWFSGKTYFEEHGTTVDQWQWHDPFIDEKPEEEILEYLEDNPPDFFGLSVYIWSHIQADSLARKIRERWPDCLIVYGGPQIDIKYSNDFFQLKPWVDLVVPSDVYGEAIITHILNNWDDLKYQNIPEVYYHRNGIKLKSKIPFNKRQFQWPRNIFESQAEYFNFDPTSSLVIYESSRGCPYKCSYCDWGGGTYTKISKKPMDTVFSEIEFLSKSKIEFFYFADANFGIFKEDIEIIKHVARMKKKYGYPLSMSVENAKNNLDRVIEIQKILIENQLTDYYKISIQNPFDDIKRNIERVDIPFEEQYEEINKLKKQYDAPILIETILGLPGDSYQRTLEGIDLFNKNNIESYRPAIWNLLPEAPAYDPAEREKFKIKTKWFEIYTFPFRYKKSLDKKDPGVRVIDNKEALLFENVIETYSYSRFEWCDMLVLTMLSGVSKAVGLSMFTEYLADEHSLKPSQVYDKIYKELFKKKGFNNAYLNEKIGMISDHLYKLVEDENLTQLEFDIDTEFPLLLSPHTYLMFVIMLDPKGFFDSIADLFSDLLDDDTINDLGHYLGEIMINLDYSPDLGKTFTTKFDWHGYFNGLTDLTKSEYTYQILDTELKFKGSKEFETSDYPDIENRIERMKQFFYHRGSNSARSKFASKIELVG